jgi:hypothetical protein
VPVVVMVLVVVLVMLVMVRMSAVGLVLPGLRGGGGGRPQRRDQRRREAHRDHALEEGPAGIIGRRLVDRLVAHGVLLSAVR